MQQIQNADKNICVFALGGLGEVGKNLYVVEYKNEIIIIDSGILFPDESLFGIDYVIPDYTYLIQNEDKIKGLFITHGHEDHIGGIPYLLKQVKVPMIYANGLSVGLIKHKLEEHIGINQKIYEFKEDEVIHFDNFNVSFFRTNHSIPDSFGIVLKTDMGSIFHTGDFKFDFTPVSQDADYYKMAKVGESGVLCLLSDSTNATLDDFSTSEKVVAENIKDLFKNVSGRIIIATFASNVHRINQIVEASILTNRKVAVFGRSMENSINVGLELGYIKAPAETFADPKMLGILEPKNLTILCTGSQGEPLAALSRIAIGVHKQIKIQKDDTVIFSSSAIPGNSDDIDRIINLLCKNGANVITQSPFNDVHATGHGGQDELKLMLKLMKPKYFMPIHGEFHMQKVHGDLAYETGVKKENIFLMQNGQVLTIGRKKAEVTYSVPTSDIYIDGVDIGGISSKIIKARKKLSENGIIIISVPIRNYQTFQTPGIISKGFVYVKENNELYRDIEKYTVDFVDGYQKKNLTSLKTDLTKALSDFLYDKTKQQPLVYLILMVQ